MVTSLSFRPLTVSESLPLTPFTLVLQSIPQPLKRSHEFMVYLFAPHSNVSPQWTETWSVWISAASPVSLQQCLAYDRIKSGDLLGAGKPCVTPTMILTANSGRVATFVITVMAGVGFFSSENSLSKSSPFLKVKEGSRNWHQNFIHKWKWFPTQTLGVSISCSVWTRINKGEMQRTRTANLVKDAGGHGVMWTNGGDHAHGCYCTRIWQSLKQLVKGEGKRDDDTLRSSKENYIWISKDYHRPLGKTDEDLQKFCQNDPCAGTLGSQITL